MTPVPYASQHRSYITVGLRNPINPATLELDTMGYHLLLQSSACCCYCSPVSNSKSYKSRLKPPLASSLPSNSVLVGDKDPSQQLGSRTSLYSAAWIYWED